MRTRRSNRTKSYTAPEYHFGDSSEEDPITRRSKKTEERDTNFDDEDVPEPDDEEEGDKSSSASDVGEAAHVSEVESLHEVKTPARRRGAAKSTTASSARKSRPPAPAAAASKPTAKATTLVAGYMEIPMPAQDGSHQMRTYIGPNDRAVRRHHLVSAWYGSDEARLETAQTLLERWFEWPVLPPRSLKYESDLPCRGAWLDDYAGRESKLAAAWREKVDAAMGGRLPVRALSPAEAAPYRLPTHTMPVLVGPGAEEEVLFAPGSGYAIAQSGIPFDYDERGDKEPSGWMFDAGGIVTSVDWAPRTDDQMTQLLAVAVMPHLDQEVHSFTDDAARIEFEAYGTVQLWEVEGEQSSTTQSARPTSLPPKLRRTLCFPHGRARRVAWNPTGTYLAVICADGVVYVVEADTESSEEFGKYSSIFFFLCITVC